MFYDRVLNLVHCVVFGKVLIAGLLFFSSLACLFGNDSVKWVVLENCTLVEGAYMDADSFHVRTNDINGDEQLFHFRIYSVDALESDNRYGDRIDEQAEYFGIEADSINEQGEFASDTVRQWLQSPFTIYTKFVDARGASKDKRYYAVVVTKQGNLADRLVENGLARIHGWPSLLPGVSLLKFYKNLYRLESAAMNARRGAWEKSTKKDKVGVAKVSEEMKHSHPTRFDSSVIPMTGTFRNVLNKSIQYFSEKSMMKAFLSFQVLERDFSEEPEYLNEHFLKTILPLYGFTAFINKEYATAADVFNNYLSLFDTAGFNDKYSFVQYSLARSYFLSEQYELACGAFAEYIESFPGKSESGLALLKMAEARLNMNEVELAIGLLDSLYKSGKPKPLRMRARVRSLEILVEHENWELAAEVLHGTEWNVSEMPDLSSLTFSTLQVGEHYFKLKQYNLALSSFHMVVPLRKLLEAQLKLVEQVKIDRGKWEKEGVDVLGKNIWRSYFQELLVRVNGVSAQLEQMEDYTANCFLHYGLCYFNLKRNLESTMIFDRLVSDRMVAKEVRSVAQFHLLLTAYQENKFDKTLELAEFFISEFSDDKRLLPQIISMIGEVYISKGLLEKAISSVYTLLIDKYPEHALFSQWLIRRGHLLMTLDKFEASRADFKQYLTLRDNGFRLQVGLWHALTHSIEKNYGLCFDELEILKPSSFGHALESEVDYQLAKTAFSMKQFDESLNLTEAFLMNYPSHWRYSEALVLKGNVYVVLGQRAVAFEVFEKVEADQLQLYSYARFKMGDIIRQDRSLALDQRCQQLIQHFGDYVESDGVRNDDRLTEAIYWLGWSWQQLGEFDKAEKLYLNALDEYGDDKNVYNLLSLLLGYESILKKLTKGAGFDEGSKKERFVEWLKIKSREALSNDRMTFYVRLRMCIAEQYEKGGSLAKSFSLVKETVRIADISDFDAMSLGTVGLRYSEKGLLDESIVFFEKLLEAYPKSKLRYFSYYGIAKSNYQKLLLDYDAMFKEERSYVLFCEDALGYVDLFEKETPWNEYSYKLKLLKGDLLFMSIRHKDDVLDEAGTLLVWENAKAEYEAVLKIKKMRGIGHVRALEGLAKLVELSGDIERAIPYWQRIYTLYRGFPEHVATAYIESARLFKQRGDYEIAEKTLIEFFKDDRLASSDMARQAKVALKSLQEDRQKVESI